MARYEEHFGELTLPAESFAENAGRWKDGAV